MQLLPRYKPCSSLVPVQYTPENNITNEKKLSCLVMKILNGKPFFTLKQHGKQHNIPLSLYVCMYVCIRGGL
jgi:hypothetical protein